MITDQIMTSLREFELHYRAAHPVPDSEYKSANTISSYMHWLFPAARKKPPNSSNLKRSPLYRYLSDTLFYSLRIGQGIDAGHLFALSPAQA